MCKLLLVSMCVWQCSFFRITDKLLPFDLSILILDQLCINLYVFIGIFFSFSFNKIVFILATLLQHTTWK